MDRKPDASKTNYMNSSTLIFVTPFFSGFFLLRFSNGSWFDYTLLLVTIICKNNSL